VDRTKYLVSCSQIMPIHVSVPLKNYILVSWKFRNISLQFQISDYLDVSYSTNLELFSPGYIRVHKRSFPQHVDIFIINILIFNTLVIGNSNSKRGKNCLTKNIFLK
jgi:hypothetical protein